MKQSQTYQFLTINFKGYWYFLAPGLGLPFIWLPNLLYTFLIFIGLTIAGIIIAHKKSKVQEKVVFYDAFFDSKLHGRIAYDNILSIDNSKLYQQPNLILHTAKEKIVWSAAGIFSVKKSIVNKQNLRAFIFTLTEVMELNLDKDNNGVSASPETNGSQEKLKTNIKRTRRKVSKGKMITIPLSLVFGLFVYFKYIHVPDQQLPTPFYQVTPTVQNAYHGPKTPYAGTKADTVKKKHVTKYSLLQQVQQLPTPDTIKMGTYKHFVGTVDSTKIAFTINQTQPHFIEASVYLPKKQNEIRLHYQNKKSTTDTLYFAAVSDATHFKSGDPYWILHYHNHQLTGFRTLKNGTQQKISLTENYDNGIQPFVYQVMDTIVYFYSNSKEGASEQLRLALLTSAKKNSNAQWLNKQSYALLKNVSVKQGQSAEEIFNTWKTKAIKHYRSSYKENKWGPKHWQYFKTFNVQYNRHQYVVIRESGKEYIGGAHGAFGSSFYDYDLKNRHKMQLSDLVSADSAALEALLEKQFRRDHHMTPDEPLDKILLKKHIMPNNNFYFDANGLTFVYNIYTLGPFVLGPISITLPWQTLSPYLKPEFAERMPIEIQLRND